jgi:hypothetical protein
MLSKSVVLPLRYDPTKAAHRGVEGFFSATDSSWTPVFLFSSGVIVRAFSVHMRSLKIL